jgi:hypothetical protein
LLHDSPSEDLTNRKRRGRVLADQTEMRLILGRHRTLQPEQTVGLEILAQACGFNRC